MEGYAEMMRAMHAGSNDRANDRRKAEHNHVKARITRGDAKLTLYKDGTETIIHGGKLLDAANDGESFARLRSQFPANPNRNDFDPA